MGNYSNNMGNTTEMQFIALGWAVSNAARHGKKTVECDTNLLPE